MARKLKVYRTSIGFFDLAIAAPSMKAAAEAWGADPDIFSRGFAKQTEDPKVVEATMAAPGVVLRRPVGSHGEFIEKAELPKAPERRLEASEGRSKREPETKSAEKAKRNADAALEREKRQAALDRAKIEAERERAKKQRERMIAKANAAFERARTRHDDAMKAIKQRRDELDNDEARENERWEREQQAHKAAMEADA